MTTLSKSEYLQRYLSSGKDEEEKKKKKRKAKQSVQRTGLRIVEDDAFLAVSASYKNVDSDEEKEDIAIIESITKEIKRKAREAPKFRSSFQPIDDSVKQEPLSPHAAESGANQQGENNPPPVKQELHDNSEQYGPSVSHARGTILDRMEYSEQNKMLNRFVSASERSSSDTYDTSVRKCRESGSDRSPLRSVSGRLTRDPDSSPKKRRASDDDVSPPRGTSGRPTMDNNKPPSRNRNDSDSDVSSPRIRKLPPKGRHDSDSDVSPPRRPSERFGRMPNNPSPRRRHDSDSDVTSSKRFVRSRRGRDSDSDQSPPRRYDQSQRRRHDTDSDQSPPRKRERSHRETSRKSGANSDSNQSRSRKDRSLRRTHGSDSDQSPPRKDERKSIRNDKSKKRTRHEKGESPSRKRKEKEMSGRHIESPERIGQETRKTLDGKVAGLQSAEALRKETEKLREQEAKMFEEMDANVSGRNAQTTVRQKHVRKGRSKMETQEDKERKEREAKKQAELQEKYQAWSKGIAQAEQRTQQLKDMARVATEPLARMADNEEMNRHLKDLVHEADPMAAMLQSKKQEQALDRGELVYPTYQGECPPNRFGIRPGYRWDGVDRSNGFEAKLAQAKNRRNAQEREYYQNLQTYE